MSQIKTAAPGGGRKMFLTSPFIDQAFALTTGHWRNGELRQQRRGRTLYTDLLQK